MSESLENSKPMASENRQLRFTISPANFKLLSKWAKFHGKTAGEFAGQVIASRIESNLDLILKLEQTSQTLETEAEPDGNE